MSTESNCRRGWHDEYKEMESSDGKFKVIVWVCRYCGARRTEQIRLQ